jgi:hypothetical protein
LEVSSTLEEIRGACERDALDGSGTTVQALAEQTRRLPAHPDGSDAAASLAKLVMARAPQQCLDAVAELQLWLDRHLTVTMLAGSYVQAMGDRSDLRLVDGGLIGRHTLTRGLTGPAIVDTPWQRAVLVPAERSGHPAHLSGHVGGVAGAMVAALVAGSEGGSPYAAQNTVRDQWWYGNAASQSWRDISPELSATVSSLVDLGTDEVMRAARLGAAPAQEFWWSSVVPPGRLERALSVAAACPERVGDRLSISERLLIGLGVVARGFNGRGGPTAQLDGVETQWLRNAFGDRWLIDLDRIGGPTPRLDGRGVARLAFWPAYEAIENEGPIDLIYERIFIDLRLTIIDYLGRHGLPGAVGGDLIRQTTVRAPLEVVASGPRDWRAVLRWIATLDDEYLDERMRQCLQDGLYTAQGF